MYLRSEIVVGRPIEDVNRFFDDPTSLARWDRSVERVEVTSDGPIRVGFTFDTISPAGRRMSYEVLRYRRGAEHEIALVSSRMFARAVWHILLDAVEGGTRITMSVTFRLKLLYFFMAPVLYLSRKALFQGLHCLHGALEAS